MPEVKRIADEPHERHRAPGEQRAVYEGIGLRGDKEYGPDDGNERDPTGVAVFCAVKRHGGGNEDESQKARGVSYPRGQPPKVKEPERFDGGKENAGAEFPKAREGEVERRVFVGRHEACFQRTHGDEDDRRHHQEFRLPKTPQHGAENGKDDVELLFDREAPQVQQGFAECVLGEVADFFQQADVLHEAGGGVDVFPEVLEFVRQQKAPTEYGDEGEEQDEVRNNAPDAFGVEGAVAERLALQAAEDDAGNEKTGDHKEDVDAEKAAVKGFRKGVINENRQDGEGSQAGDVVTPEGRRCGGGYS